MIKKFLLFGLLLIFSIEGLAQGNAEVIRVGAYPNITHSQPMVGKATGWFEKAVGQNVKIEWKTFNAGPAAIEALFAGAIDMTYIGPNPAIQGYVRSNGEALRIVAGATSGGASRAITIVDPAPLPPSGLHLSASDRLEMGWVPSPTSTVTGYKISLGTASGVYDRQIDAAAATSYTELNVIPGQTYYVVVRAYDWAMSKDDVVTDLATVPEQVLAPYRDDFTANGMKLKRTIRKAFTSDDFVRF